MKWSNIVDQWLGMRQRDRNALVLLSLVVLPIILFVALIQPMQRNALETNSRLTERQALHSWLLLVGGDAKAKRQRAAQHTDGEIKAGIDQQISEKILKTAQLFSINIQKYERDNNDALRVWIESSRFEQLIPFVQALSEQGIMVMNLNVDSAGTPGVVNARGTWFSTQATP